MAAHDTPNGGTGARAAAAAAAPAATDPRERPIGDLVKDLAGQTSTLVRQEIELAQAELSQKGKVAGKGAGCWRAPPWPACSRSAPSPPR